MTQFSARYYDGETSRGHDVQVRVDTDNVLSVDGLDTPLSLALAELRIAPRLGNTARALTFPSGRAQSISKKLFRSFAKRNRPFVFISN